MNIQVSNLELSFPCQALDQNGNMRGKQASHSVNYHGDSQIYHHRIGWVKVNLCEEHYTRIKRGGIDEIN